MQAEHNGKITEGLKIESSIQNGLACWQYYDICSCVESAGKLSLEMIAI